MTYRPTFKIRIEHVPSGESIVVTDLTARTMTEAKRKGLRALISRIRHKYPNPPAITFVNYKLPTGIQYPDELPSYRIKENT